MSALACFMMTTLLAAAEPSPATAPAPASAPGTAAGPSLLVLPMATDGARAAEMGPALERALVRALEAQGRLVVKRRSDVEKVVQKATLEQMTGCETDACMLDLSDQLDVDRLVRTRLRVTPTRLVLQLAVLERTTAKVLLRRELGAASLDALLGSLDTLARDISGGAALVADDPTLAARLGTTEEVANDFRKVLRANPDVDPVEAWTAYVIDHNRESDALALAQGFTMLGITSMLFVGTPVVVVGAVLLGLASFDDRVPGFAGGPPNSGATTFTFPTLLVVGTFLSTVVLLLPLPLVPVLVALLVVDALDLGRVPVKRSACCLDARAVRNAARPGMPKRLASTLAGLAGALALAMPLAWMLSSVIATPIGLAWRAVGPKSTLPGLQVNLFLFAVLYTALGSGAGLLGFMGLLAFATTAVAVSFGMVVSEYAPVVDRE